MGPNKTLLKGAAKASVENKIVAIADAEFEGDQDETMEVEKEDIGMSTADRVKAATSAFLRMKQKRLDNPEESDVHDDEYYENWRLSC